MKTTTVHDQTYEYHSWDALGREIFELTKKILDSGEKYDRVIALAKGGLAFSRSLYDFLNVKDISSIQIEFYTGVGTTNKTPVITQSLPVSIKDENVLIFDDVVDKGDTMKLAIDYLKYHGARKIMTSSIIYKPWSKIAPDFFAHQTESWVIFPNESREHIELLTEMWKEEGDDTSTIIKNLIEIGIPKDEVEFFSQIE
jgi:hypoxanthine phosphoribosyltransferase